MGVIYATVDELTALDTSLTTEQTEQAEILLETASAKLRLLAKKYGKDIDVLIASDEDYKLAVKDIVINAVRRALSSYADSSSAVTQESQSALGYSVSMTYLNAGQSLYFLRNELKDLGILRQKYGAVEVYDCAAND